MKAATLRDSQTASHFGLSPHAVHCHQYLASVLVREFLGELDPLAVGGRAVGERASGRARSPERPIFSSVTAR